MPAINLALFMLFVWYGMSDFHQEPVRVCVFDGELSGISGSLVDYDEALGMYEIKPDNEEPAVMIEKEFVYIGACDGKNK